MYDNEFTIQFNYQDVRVPNPIQLFILITHKTNAFNSMTIIRVQQIMCLHTNYYKCIGVTYTHVILKPDTHDNNYNAYKWEFLQCNCKSVQLAKLMHNCRAHYSICITLYMCVQTICSNQYLSQVHVKYRNDFLVNAFCGYGCQESRRQVC